MTLTPTQLFTPTAGKINYDPTGLDIALKGDNWSRVVQWHDPTRLGTPAFWIEQTRTRRRPASFQVGTTLAEEVSLCILGGHGITEEMAFTSFTRLKYEGLLEGGMPVSRIEEALRRPFKLEKSGREVRYRFPAMKAQRVAGALQILESEEPPSTSSPRELRDWLVKLPGVGLKTASWTVRNLTQSDEIAIIDIHIRRAGVAAGVFDPTWRLPRDYACFEQAFVAWARIGNVPTADLDWCIWSWLAELGRDARLLFRVRNLKDLD